MLVCRAERCQLGPLCGGIYHDTGEAKALKQNLECEIQLLVSVGNPWRPGIEDIRGSAHRQCWTDESPDSS